MWKRYLWVRNIIFLGVLSFLAAKIGNTLILSRIGTPQRTLERTDAVQSRPSPAEKKSLNTYSLIPRRNIFNSQYLGETSSTDGGKGQKPSAPLKKAELNVKLIGTVSGSRENSFAIIEDGSTRTQQLYQIDDTIQEQAKIIDISRCKVVLARDGNQEVLECPEEGAQEGEKPATVAYGAPPAETAPASGVKMVSETEFLIDENEVENALNNINQLLTQIRVVPSFQDGKPNGFKVFAIKPDSLFAKVGLKNGDVIQKINGRDITSPEKALQVFQDLKSEKSLSVEMLRRGGPQSLRYEIR